MHVKLLLVAVICPVVCWIGFLAARWASRRLLGVLIGVLMVWVCLDAFGVEFPVVVRHLMAAILGAGTGFIVLIIRRKQANEEKPARVGRAGFDCRLGFRRD